MAFHSRAPADPARGTADRSADRLMPGGRPRLVGLDGIRAVAIGGVLLFHLGLQGHCMGTLRRVLDCGEFGVSVFFVLSGFLITWLLQGDESRHGRVLLGDFFLRRAFRILPAAYAYLTALALMTAGGIYDLRPTDLLVPAVFVRGLFGEAPSVTAHFWSLGVEEQFYLLWPVVLVLTPARLRVRIVLAFLLGGLLWRAGMIWLSADAGAASKWHLETVAGRLLIGCLLALVRRSPAGLRRLRTPWVQSGAATAVYLATVAALLCVSTVAGPFVGYVANLLACVCVALVINAVIDGRAGGLARRLDARPLVWVGRMSYSLYVWQQMFCLAGDVPIPLNLLLTFGAAYISFNCVERPALALRDRLWARGAVPSCAASISAPTSASISASTSASPASLPSAVAA